MKNTLGGVLLFAVGVMTIGPMSLGAQDSAATTSPAPHKSAAVAPKPKTPKARPVQTIKPITIPTGAERGKDGYRYTDVQGKVWIYRETPFGITRAPETAAVVEAAPQTALADPDAHVTAIADGDTVRFERVGPFGPTRWKKNKAELSPQEQKIWEREQAKGKQ